MIHNEPISCRIVEEKEIENSNIIFGEHYKILPTVVLFLNNT